MVFQLGAAFGSTGESMPGCRGFQDGLEEFAEEERGETVRAEFEVVAVGFFVLGEGRVERLIGLWRGLPSRRLGVPDNRYSCIGGGLGAAADIDGAICSIEHFGEFQTDATGSTCDDIDAAAEIVERFFGKGRGRWEDLGKIRHCKVVSMLFTRDTRDARQKKVLNMCLSTLYVDDVPARSSHTILKQFCCLAASVSDSKHRTQAMPML
ncbi:hypothetical protein KC358_g83 [Hortaea werneckii]|nr:hypothetical protein KC358_g83 [Hortaea werneckii]